MQTDHEDMTPEEKLQWAAIAQKILLERQNDKLGQFQPYPKQNEYLNAEERVVVFQAGNRSGKTCMGVVDDLLYALGRHPVQKHEPPVDIWVVGYDFMNHVKGVLIPSFFEWCPPELIKSFSKEPPVLELTNGSKIFLKSAESGRDKFMGAKIHRLHIDEEIPGDVVEECRIRLIDYGGDIRITATPIKGVQWLKETIKDPDTKVIRSSMFDNPHIDHKIAKKELESQPEILRKTRELGDFMALSGLIFPELLDPQYWVSPHEYPVDRDCNILMCLDPGYNVTAALWFAIFPDDSVICFQEYYGKKKTPIENAKQIHLLERNYKARITRRLIDPAAKQHGTDPNSTRDQYAKEGLKFDYATNDVMAGILELKNYLMIGDNGHSRLKFWDTCTELREEFLNYIWEEPGKSDIEKPRKGNDHGIDTCRYAIFSKPTFKSQEYLRKSWLRKEIGIEPDIKII